MNRPAKQLDKYTDLARTRRASRAPLPDPYPDSVLRTILETANRAPSAADARPWEFIVLTEEDLKRKLADIFSEEPKYKGRIDPTFPLAGNSKEFIDAPATVLVGGDPRYYRWWPQAPPRAPYGSREKLFQQSLAMCTMTLHLAGTAAGLGTTWVSTREPTQEKLRDVLDLPEWFRIVSTAPLGYPDLDRVPLSKSRISLDEKLHEDAFDGDSVPTYEEIMARKEESREDVYQPSEEDDSRWETEITLDEFAALSRSQHSARGFKDEPISEGTLQQILEASIESPSAANSQPWEFIRVRDESARRRLADILHWELEYRQTVDPDFSESAYRDTALLDIPPKSVIDDAAEVIVVAGNQHLEKLWPQVPDGSRRKLFHHSIATATTSLHYGATAAGLATKLITPYVATEAKLRDALNMPSWYRIETIALLGVPDKSRTEDVTTTDVESKIHRNGLNEAQIPTTTEIARAFQN
ncbi:nitroreductase family protein [Saliphagus sp. GCM10025334]